MGTRLTGVRFVRKDGDGRYGRGVASLFQAYYVTSRQTGDGNAGDGMGLASTRNNFSTQSERPWFDLSGGVTDQLGDATTVRFVLGMGGAAESAVRINDQMVTGLVSANFGTCRALRHGLRWAVLYVFQ
jgi:hypothetical protein